MFATIRQEFSECTALVRKVQGNKLVATALFVVGTMIIAATGAYQYSVTHAACNPNDIMACGFSSSAEFKQKLNQNAEGDLQTIYNHYRIPRDLQYVNGTAYKDGTVRVNGRVIAKDAYSLGRLPLADSMPSTIGGKTYYASPSRTAFVSDSVPAAVILNSAGNFEYAILKPCGNPLYAVPVTPPPTPTPTPPTPQPRPSYSCVNLDVAKLSERRYRFTAQANGTNGARVTGYTFTFGDGTSQTVNTTSVEHEYAEPGDYQARVSARFTVGSQSHTVTAPACAERVTVEQAPSVGCVALIATKQDRVRYAVTISKTNVNASYLGATIDYGDGTVRSITDTSDSHTYQQPGNYTIKAILRFSVNGAEQSATCQTNITVDAPPATPASVVLPQTGPGTMIGAGVGIASMILAGSFYANSRKDLLASMLSR